MIGDGSSNYNAGIKCTHSLMDLWDNPNIVEYIMTTTTGVMRQIPKPIVIPEVLEIFHIGEHQFFFSIA